ncbi:MAG: amidohydrolase family protein [Acidimicrobiia bacterium]|nr:amidohydrolase family protein [Acidimicrobiia bacterium]
MSYDLVIKNGILVDGSGTPRRRADLAVKDGRVARVGYVDEAECGGAEVIDAEGMIVAPGIVDVHTHYDPQLTFDPYATSSCYHGVTTVLAGNCGFSMAPVKAADRDYTTRMFAKVEGMDPQALGGVRWEHESFPEWLATFDGKLGVNMATYLGHCALRRWVMGPDASERAATDEEVAQMRAVLAEAMQAGAAGFSSTASSTQVDGDGRPVASSLSDRAELLALCEETGRNAPGGASIAFLPRSAVGGLNDDDEQLLIDMGVASRLPVVIQGLGGRSKVDAPVDWETTEAFLDRTSAAGAAVYNMLRAQPFDRPFSFAKGTALYGGVFPWQEWLDLPLDERRAALADTGRRDVMRDAVEHPNTDPDAGSTMPPPKWDAVFVGQVRKSENEKWLHRSIADIAAEQGKAPADAMLDLAADEDLETVFRWNSETEEWATAVAEHMRNAHMIVGVSDGGAHLDRDDCSEWSTYFLANWVRKRHIFTLEEGVRQMSSMPAAIAGLTDRGLLQPGYWADVMIFDPEAVSPDFKGEVADFPNGSVRFSARPKGVRYTIVNGEPIVIDGELTSNLPGSIAKPGQSPTVPS